MKDKLEKRLEQLNADYLQGCKLLEETNNKQSELRETLLRMNGAIRVLQEELADYDGDEVDASADDNEVNMQLVDSNASGT